VGAAAGATLYVYYIQDPQDVEPAFARLIDARVEALIAFPDAVILGQRDKIVQAALKHRVPDVHIDGGCGPRPDHRANPG